jgi:biopolymer transport protein ExbD
MNFKSRLKPSHTLVDLTPLVDVIFLLLIFFVVTSNILPLKSLDIENPRLDRDSPPLLTQLLVVVDAHQVIYVGSKKAIVDLGSLKEALLHEVQKFKAEGGKDQPTVVLSLDKQVPYDIFLKLLSRIMELQLPLRLSYKGADDPV